MRSLAHCLPCVFVVLVGGGCQGAVSLGSFDGGAGPSGDARASASFASSTTRTTFASSSSTTPPSTRGESSTTTSTPLGPSATSTHPLPSATTFATTTTGVVVTAMEAGPPEAGRPAPDGAVGDATLLDAPAPLIDGATLLGDGGVCPHGSVTFRMRAPAGYSYQETVGGPYDLGDGTWYDILNVPWLLAANTTCGTCRPVTEAAGCTSSEIPAGGITWTWPGTAISGCDGYPGSGYCDFSCTSTYSQETLSCGEVACMPAGRYTVKLCAIPAGSECDGETACRTTTFDYPASGDVVVVIP